MYLREALGKTTWARQQCEDRTEGGQVDMQKPHTAGGLGVGAGFTGAGAAILGCSTHTVVSAGRP